MKKNILLVLCLFFSSVLKPSFLSGFGQGFGISIGLLSGFVSGSIGTMYLLDLQPSKAFIDIKNGITDGGTKIVNEVVKVGDEGTIILKELQKPLIQKLVDESDRNRDYLMNLKPFGIENGVLKISAGAVILGLSYYGYKKYQENVQDQNKKDDSDK